MRKICKITGKEFQLSDSDLRFYQQMEVDPPTLCPEERLRRKMAYRNFRSLYSRNCSATGGRIISMYHDRAEFPVYGSDYWWGDNWTAFSYGVDYSQSEQFFPQYQRLNNRVPRYAVNNTKSENCLYSNFTFESKDCYLVFGCVKDEHCLYGHIVWNSEYCVDNLYIYQCQWCSHSVDLVGCYDLHYSTECTNCQQGYFLHDCINCRNCFGCFNLRKKEYCFFNQQLTRAEYEKQLEEYLPLSPDRVDKMSTWLEQQKINNAVFPPGFYLSVENCCGNHLYYSRNLKSCFDLKNSEDCSYCYTLFGANNCYDVIFGSGRFCLESVTQVNCEDIICCHSCAESNSLAYCEFCYGSHDLFGCNGLRRAAYCILNKQYSKEDYFKLRSQIVANMKTSEEWGEFFPIENSPFAYNESIVNEYLPLTRSEVIARGLNWKEEEKISPPPEDRAIIPGDIRSVEDSILKDVFYCEKTQKAYRITAAELAFYRKMKLPLPRTCPDVRHLERMNKRHKRSLWKRDCLKCKKSFISAIPQNVFQNVMCDGCYCSSFFDL